MDNKKEKIYVLIQNKDNQYPDYLLCGSTIEIFTERDYQKAKKEFNYIAMSKLDFVNLLCITNVKYIHLVAGHPEAFSEFTDSEFTDFTKYFCIDIKKKLYFKEIMSNNKNIEKIFDKSMADYYTKMKIIHGILLL